MSADTNHNFFGILESITLTKNGMWLSNGEEITHRGTILGFSKHLVRGADGPEIRIGPEKKSVLVEDTLFFVTALDGLPKSGFQIRLNDERLLKLDPSTLRYSPERLTCLVPNANDQTQEEAKFLSAPYHELLKHLEHDTSDYSLTIENKKYALRRER